MLLDVWDLSWEDWRVGVGSDLTAGLKVSEDSFTLKSGSSLEWTEGQGPAIQRGLYVASPPGGAPSQHGGLGAARLRWQLCL